MGQSKPASAKDNSRSSSRTSSLSPYGGSVISRASSATLTPPSPASNQQHNARDVARQAEKKPPAIISQDSPNTFLDSMSAAGVSVTSSSPDKMYSLFKDFYVQASSIPTPPDCPSDSLADNDSGQLPLRTPASTNLLKVTALKVTALKDTALKDAALKFTALEDTALKDTALKDTAPKVTALKDAAPKDVALPLVAGVRPLPHVLRSMFPSSIVPTSISSLLDISPLKPLASTRFAVSRQTPACPIHRTARLRSTVTPPQPSVAATADGARSRSQKRTKTSVTFSSSDVSKGARATSDWRLD